MLLLTQKIKADGKTYENGSRQTIRAIEGDKIRFESGLDLGLDDGRVRQGDAVTTYKAQGASKTEMIRVEDNRSLLAMANREDLHVAFTRHRDQARMFVQDISVLRQVANRSLIKDVMLAGRVFTRFQLDIGIGDAVVLPTELIKGRDWLGFAGIAPGQFMAISKAQQFAEKFHALPFRGLMRRTVG